MKIGYLGWGSLVWDPRTLHYKGSWFEDGPLLPVEFGRQSKDGRITLVLSPGTASVRALWTLSALDTVESAQNDLAEREGATNPEVGISVWRQGDQADTQNGLISSWAQKVGLDAIVWTSLGPKIGADHRMPTIEEVLAHLRGLSAPRRAIAEQYVRRAPKQIDTVYRRKIEMELGWTRD